MRLVWYAGASTALAASVVVSAFHQRSNFYSAMVHLSQSNLCLMIIINLIYLVYGSFMYCLQRVCFGQLRPVEIEQLYEKAWFAVTETCLAMTIFRGQFGVFFLVMFTSLVTGKVWGWIGEGRIEILEQQPPSNPRLFHTRLSISLILSLIYDVALLHYSVSTVIQQARPDMMVMFLFEFAILTVSSAHTGLRYILSLMEASIVKKQTQQRLEDRRRQIRESNREILRRREAGEATEAEMEEPLPSEDDVDEMDIEVPGWEAKGQWVLSLDLWSDFLKLCIYGAFFTVLLIFYGLPIHIMRDLFLTTRSFIKRLGALMRYRQAVRDMNKYPDATEEELSRENTCIICREEMHIWNPNDATQVERSRPKKLPCGHILHFGCLKSWLERQQVCPTCRRSVAMDGPQGAARNRDAMMFRVGLNFPAGQNQAQPPANGAAPGAQNNAPQAPQAGNGVRMINLGPLRLGFAQGGVEDIQNMAQRLGMPQDVVNGAAAPPAATPQPQGQAASLDVTPDAIFAQLREIEQRIQRQTLSLRLAEQETATLRLLLLELQRIRQIQTALDGSAAGTNNTAAPAGAAAVPHAPGLPTMMPPPFIPGVPQPPSAYTQFLPRVNSPSVTRLGVEGNAQAIPSGSAELPEGVSIPAGWTLMPLQRLDAHATNSGSSSTANSQAHPGANATSSGSAIGTTNQASASAPEVNNLEAAQNGHRPVSTGAPGPESTTASAGFSFNTPREPVQMAQPTPVLPNWGGRAQLFSNETGHLPFGVQQNGADSSTPGTRDRSVDSQARSEAPKSVDSPAVHAPPEEGSSNEGFSSEDKGKGKARSVTVEEAEDEDA